MTRLLRLAAFAIAAAGAIDPAMTISGAARVRIAVVSLEPASGDAASIRDRVARNLSSSYEVVGAVTSDTAAAIVVGDRNPDASTVARLGSALPDALPVATVTTPAAARPGARIVSVDAPREIPPATAIDVEAVVESRGMTGRTTDAVASIGGLEVARASHTWTAAGERWRASLDVVPVGEPPYVVRLALRQTPAENAASDAADVAVGLRRDPIRVEFYDPRPSWAVTFVRRALEADPRFRASTLSFTSRGIATQSGDAVALDDRRLDAFDAVIVGGLDRVSAADARALDRYLRERGGAVIVIPDQRIDAGPARDLVPDVAERLLEQPAKLTSISAASLQASELLVVRALPPGAVIVARLPGPSTKSGPSRAPSSDAAESLAVIVSSPRGDGRLLFSGAMDAWRYRAADGAAFDRFWQSTIAGLALAVPPPIAIDVEPSLLRPGERARVITRLRSHDLVSVRASVDGTPIRLVPDAEGGVYRGDFTARNEPGRSTIEVRAELGATVTPRSEGSQLRATVALPVQRDVQRLLPPAAPSLSMLAESHRGVDLSPERISELAGFVRGAVTVPRVPLVRHPMRSTWWIVPFALCLSAEWWLRRRRGLR